MSLQCGKARKLCVGLGLDLLGPASEHGKHASISLSFSICIPLAEAMAACLASLESSLVLTRGFLQPFVGLSGRKPPGRMQTKQLPLEAFADT